MLWRTPAWAAVDDAGYAILSNQPCDRIGVGDVHSVEGESPPAIECREAGLLQGGIIIVVDDVDADHRLTAFQQAMRGRMADKAGGARDEDGRCHIGITVMLFAIMGTKPLKTG